VTTPTEGPERPDSIRANMVTLGYDTPELQAAFAEALEKHRREVARQEELARKTFRGRVERFGPTAGIASAAAAIASPQGQEVIGDASQWAGDQAVAAGEGIGHAAAEGYRASVDGLQSAGEEIGRQWDQGVRELNEQGEAAREAIVDGAEATGRGIADGAGWLRDQAVDAARDLGHGVAEAARATADVAQAGWNGVSGWAVETWGTATELAHQAGAFVAQQGDAIAANPESHALVAAAAVGAVVAATPQLREAVGKAANAVNRSARNGWAAATSLPGRAAQGAKNLMDQVRNSPQMQYVMAKAGMGPRETQKAVTEVQSITAGKNPTLPSTGELMVPPPGQDPAMQAREGKVHEGKVVLGREQEAGGATELGEAASNPQRAIGNNNKPEIGGR